MRNPSLPNWLVVSTLGAVVVGTLAMSKHADPGNDKDCWDDASCAATKAGYVVLDPGVKPYDTCIAAAKAPGASGYATEVCEPLGDTWVERDMDEYVFTGPMQWTNPGGSRVGVPGLAEDIADRCADTPDALLDCVGAIIGERTEHQS